MNKKLELPAASDALPGRAEPIDTAETHFVSGRALKGPYPEGHETAYFALGCYWSVAKRRGLNLATLPGTGQSDYFLTYHACVTKQQVPTLAGLRFNGMPHRVRRFCRP